MNVFRRQDGWWHILHLFCSMRAAFLQFCTFAVHEVVFQSCFIHCPCYYYTEQHFTLISMLHDWAAVHECRRDLSRLYNDCSLIGSQLPRHSYQGAIAHYSTQTTRIVCNQPKLRAPRCLHFSLLGTRCGQPTSVGGLANSADK